jgi:hypothetical protein
MRYLSDSCVLFCALTIAARSATTGEEVAEFSAAAVPQLAREHDLAVTGASLAAAAAVTVR